MLALVPQAARRPPTSPAHPSGRVTEPASSSLRSGRFSATPSGKGVRYRSPRRCGHQADPVGSAARRRQIVMIAFAPTCRAARTPALCTRLQAVPSLRAGPSPSPAHSPIPPTLRSTKEGHFHPGQALLKIPSFVPLRERCSLRSLQFGPPSPGRAGGRKSANRPVLRKLRTRRLSHIPARRRPVGSGLPPHFVQFQTGPSLNRRNFMRSFVAGSSHVAAPLCGQACGAVAPQPSRQHRIKSSSVPSGVPLCGLPFRESPASPVSPSGLRPFTLSPQKKGRSYNLMFWLFHSSGEGYKGHF